jgi:hypothetical protein
MGHDPAFGNTVVKAEDRIARTSGFEGPRVLEIFSLEVQVATEPIRQNFGANQRRSQHVSSDAIGSNTDVFDRN